MTVFLGPSYDSEFTGNHKRLVIDRNADDYPGQAQPAIAHLNRKTI